MIITIGKFIKIVKLLNVIAINNIQFVVLQLIGLFLYKET